MIQYREDGTLVSKETFVDGIPDGPYEYYNHMGIIRQSGETKNYRKHGTITNTSNIRKQWQRMVTGSKRKMNKSR